MDKLRIKIIKASYYSGACHIGSALSCIDIIVDIYKIKKKKDIFIFGKASGVGAYYCFKYSLKKATELLKKYPLPAKETGLPWSGGSLGTGLPVACGMALGNKTRDVYILLGDGDCQEGTFYESLLFARQHNLTNLKIYIDRNHLQALGITEDILGIDKALEVLQDIFPFKVIETIKGKGVPFIENMGYKNHYYNINEISFKRAILELDKG
jgi:transketolase